MSCNSGDQSSLRSLLETEMRGEMLNFIDEEVADLGTPFAKYWFYDPALGKRCMHEEARRMDLSTELEYLISCSATLHLPNSHVMAEADDDQISRSACGSVCEMSSERSPIRSTEGTSQHLSCNETNEILQEPYYNNVSNHGSSTGENTCKCYLDGSSTEILIQNVRSVYLPFINEMRGELHRRLFDITKGRLANYHRTLIKRRLRESWIDLNRFSLGRSSDRSDDWQEKHDCLREKFLSRAQLEPPQVLRMIDIEATCRQQERVVLVDYWADDVQQVGYTAISHTYGYEVYEVFDCVCTTECCANMIRPRCSDKPCPHDHQNASSAVVGSEKRNRVVNDILGMCAILKAAGVNYAWHDGVCIAQHNESEVVETIAHIGWVYASANNTIVFLHYVGRPMAPIKHGNVLSELNCRWHTRVWTFQEAALSKCRRYCVRVCSSPLSDCQSLEEFEEKIALCYDDHFSKIEVITEERFFEILMEMERVLCHLLRNTVTNLTMPDDDDMVVESNWMWIKAKGWYDCIGQLLKTLLWTCFDFPTLQTALDMCSSQDSKHVGDRINSILALTEVNGFVAHKDKNVEVSIVEFFNRQGQRGLAMAVFSTNYNMNDKDNQYLSEAQRQHSWPPLLWGHLFLYSVNDADTHNRIKFQVSADGSMEMTGDLVCVEVIFTAKLNEKYLYQRDPSEDAYEKQRVAAIDLLKAHQDMAHLAIDLTFYNTMAHFRANISGTYPSRCNMGKVFLSAFQKSSGQVVFATQIEEGESFHAHLVFPNYLLEPHAISVDDLGLPMLLVQGSLDAQVLKIGLYMHTYAFVDCLKAILHHPAVCTTIRNLVII